MKDFGTLFRMQMRERVDLSFLKDKKKTLFKTVYGVLYFVSITALCYIILLLARTFHLFSPLNRIPLSVMAVVLLVMTIFNLVSCVTTLTNSLYFSKDNQVLITFPVSPNKLFVSKLFVHFVYELKKTFTFIVPVFLAYGLLSSMPIYYYLWLCIMMLLLSAFIVTLAGLLSIPMIFIKSFFDNHNSFRIIFWIIVLGVLTYGMIKIIGLIPNNIDLIRSWAKVSKTIDEFLSWFVSNFKIAYVIALCMCGRYSGFTTTFFTKYTYIGFLGLLGTVAILFILNYLVSRPIYLKIISTRFEFNKKPRRKCENIPHKSNYTTFFYEFLKDLRNADLMKTTITLLVIAPIAVFTLNKIYAAINTALFGTYLTAAFNVLIISLFILSNNISVGSVYSREGENLYILNTMPKNPSNLLFSRLGYYIISTLLLLSITLAIFFHFSTLLWYEKTMMFLTMFMVALIHIMSSAELDFLNPKTSIYRTEGKASKNTNEVKSIIMATVFSIVFFGIALFFYIKAPKGIWLKLFLLSASILALKTHLFNYKVKILFREGIK